MQKVGLGVVGELAEEVLVAGSLAIVVVLVVEPRAGQGHVAGVGMQTSAATQLGSQRLDQASAAQNAREGVIALGAVKFETEFAGQINPHRHFLFLPRCGIGVGQALDDLPPDEVTEQVGLGGFGDVLQIVDLALAQSVQHEAAVVGKGDEVHFMTCAWPLVWAAVRAERARDGRWRAGSGGGV